MLLILTNSNDATADFLVSEISCLGLNFIRFDTDCSPEKIRFSYRDLRPSLCISGDEYYPESFSNVWYRRPERMKHPQMDESPEGKFIHGEWAEALEGFFSHIHMSKWMNHPSHNVGASHKIEQLSTAQRLGLSIPATLVTQDLAKAKEFYDNHKGKIIVKPMARGYIDRPGNGPDSLIYTNRVCSEHLASLEELKFCPTLFQQYIDKTTDVRITIVDYDFHAVAIFANDAEGSQRCDIRRNNMDDVRYEPIKIPNNIEIKLRMMMGQYELRFAAIDMVVDINGHWHFLEINPNGQWAWLDEAGGASIIQSFIKSFGKD